MLRIQKLRHLLSLTLRKIGTCTDVIGAIISYQGLNILISASMSENETWTPPTCLRTRFEKTPQRMTTPGISRCPSRLSTGEPDLVRYSGKFSDLHRKLSSLKWANSRATESYTTTILPNSYWSRSQNCDFQTQAREQQLITSID